jgi:hypothetical protein
VSRVVTLLWPWLGVENRTRLVAMRDLLEAEVAEMVGNWPPD